MKITSEHLIQAAKASKGKQFKRFYQVLDLGFSSAPEEAIHFCLFGGEYTEGSQTYKIPGRLPWNGSFWKSDLPKKHYKIIFGATAAPEFYAALFNHYNAKHIPTELLGILFRTYTQEFCQACIKHAAFREPGFLRAFMEHPEMLAYFSYNHKEELKTGIRETQFLLQDRFWAKVSFLHDHQDAEWKDFYTFWKYARELHSKYASSPEADFHRRILQQYSVPEILIETTAYMEYVRRFHPRSLGNWGHVFQTEVNLGHVLNMILKDKIALGTQQDATWNEEELAEKLKIAMPRLPTVDEQLGSEKNIPGPYEQKYPTKQRIRQLINFYFGRHNFESTLDRYSSGELDQMRGKTTLVNNQKAFNFWRNDKKGTYIENYTHSALVTPQEREKIKQIPELFPRAQSLSAKGDEKRLLFLGFPPKVEFEEGKSIELAELFRVLWFFAEGLVPTRLDPLPVPPQYLSQFKARIPAAVFSKHHPTPYMRLKHKKSDKFTAAFKENYLVWFSRIELEKELRGYFKMNNKEARDLVDFLVLDIDNSSGLTEKIDFFGRPFIKVGSKLFWMGSFLRDRQWAILMHRRIAVDEIVKNTVQVSRHLEKQVEKTFRHAGFQACSSVDFKLADGRKSDLDIVAYEGGHLFFLECKMTYVTEDPGKIHRYRKRTLDKKAGRQLKRAKEFLEKLQQSPADFMKFFRKQGITFDRPVGEIKLIPILISNTTRSDDYRFNHAFLKISLWELDIILTNGWDNLIYNKIGETIGDFQDMKTTDFQRFHSHQSPKIRKEDSELLEDPNLWMGESKCNAGILSAALKKEKVWRFLDGFWDVSAETREAAELDALGSYWDREFPF